MISVCVATYNGEKYLRQQLDSILSCIGVNDEIIISDDGSTDATKDIIKEYLKKYHQISLCNGPGKGVIANFENALSKTHGDIIFLSDQDDVWHKDKVARVLETFKSSKAGVVVHNAEIVDATGKPKGVTLFELRQSKPGFIKNFKKNSYVGCCMAVSRDVLQHALPIPLDVEMHDWWIGLIAELFSNSVFIDDKLIDYRRHGKNISGLHHYPILKMVSNRVCFIYEILKRCWRERM